MVVCDYCKKSAEGLPHTCKYCGKVHCSKHLLPESHDCEGLKHIKEEGLKNWKNLNSKSIKNEDDFVFREQMRGRRHHRFRTRKNFSYNARKPRLRFPRFKFNYLIRPFLFAAAFFILAFYVTNSFTILLEVISWIYFTYVLYKDIFIWANGINMGNDLAFFGLRILGGIVTLAGFYVGFAVLLSLMLAPGYSVLYIPFFILVFGLIFLGAFIAFKTNRRHRVVGIWGA